MTRFVVVCISFIIVSLIFAGMSDAKVDPKSIVGMWLFDKGSGDTAKDSSQNDHDGKLVNNPEWVEGKNGGGLEFDGTNHVEIPATDTTDDYLDGFTYLLWVKPTGAPPNANTRLIERDWHNPTIQISNAGNFYGSTVVGGGLGSSAVTGGKWLMGEWSFVALTYNGTILELYVDDEMVKDLKVAKPDFTKNNAQGAIWLA